MIRTLGLNRQTTAILENAYDIGYEKEANSIWNASFSLPINDPKVEKVELLEYVEIDDVGLFIIIPKQTKKSSNSVTFQCEHVLSTLLNSTLFKYHQLSNYTTADVLKYLLDQQNHKHWKLGKVDFTRYFHYSWENENLLSALFSVPKSFEEQYLWDFDTSSYPWTLNLIEPDNEPVCRIKEGYNLVDFDVEEDPMGVYNRVYPLGAGEGVNQLTVESANNGIPYIENRKPGEEIRETVWADKRFTDAETLKANAEALLKKWKEPVVTWNVSAVDVSSITGLSIDKFKVGKIVRLQLDDYPTTDLRIMKESKSDMTGNPGDVQLEIGNVTEDLGTTTSDMQRRQQINELYSQGATNILNSDRVDNADPEHPIKFKVRIPEDAVNVNFMELTWETDYFRGYTKGSKAGGSYIKGSTVQSKSTKGGGGQTTSSGGGQTTSSGGGTSTTSGPPNTMDFIEKEAQTSTVSGHSHTYWQQYWDLDAMGRHQHTVSTPNHTHSVSNHTHSVSDHTHDFEVEIPAIDIPDHSHEQVYGIYEHDRKPSKLEIKVDGHVIPETSLKKENLDIVDYLEKDENGKIKRNRFATVEIRPIDELAQISAGVIWGLFIQSHKGGTY